MGLIGTFGDIVFEVSSKKVQTFNNFKREGSGRWANHDIQKQKPMPEFLGPGQEQITFSIRLDVGLGVNPEVELEKLRKMRDTGKIAYLIIGQKPVTQNMWLLESVSEDQRTFDGAGRLIVAEANLTLKEYPVKKGGGK